MNEEKMKFAFAKVKDDMKSINSHISHLEEKVEKNTHATQLSSEVKKHIEEIKKFNLERFVTNMQKDFSSINSLLKDFNNRFSQSSGLMEKFSKQMETYNLEFSDFKKKVISTQSRTENTNLDLEMLNQKFSDFQELISEKINLEISQMKLEFTEEIAKVYDRVYEEMNSNKKVSIKNKKR